VLTGQFAHATEELAPATPEYAPAAQLIHTAEVFAPATPEYAPAGQFVHDALPLTFLNFPATQAVQLPPSGPVYPVLHLQSEIVFDVTEKFEVENAGHDVHVGTPSSTLISYRCINALLPPAFKRPQLIGSVQQKSAATLTNKY
jgi:hypothetical protein